MNSTTHEIEREEVMAYLDGELPPARASAVAAHLNQCADCAALAADLRGLSQQLSQWHVEPTAQFMNQELKAALAEQGAKKRFRPIRTLVLQLGAVAALLVIIVSLTIPNLMRSRITANESSTVGSLRTLNTVCVQYSTTYGRFPRSLGQMGPGNPPSSDAADLIDAVLASGWKSGYRFVYTPGATDANGNIVEYSISAEPVEVDKTGRRRFYTDQTGVIRSSAEGPASAQSAPIGGGVRAFLGVLDPAASPIQAERTVAEGTVSTPLGRMIIRSASLTITVKDFEVARAAVEQILRQHGGYVAQLSTRGSSAGRRSLSATLRVPSTGLDAALAELKELGRVESETLGGDEVTKQHADLVAQQTNARNTEKRLTQVLENRTGKVADVLEVEREIARVRQEVERLDAQRKTVENQVALATVQLQLEEEYQAQVSPPQPSPWLLMRNAGVEGYRSVAETALGMALFFLSTGPSLLFWAALLAWPARAVWRRVATRMAAAPANVI